MFLFFFAWFSSLTKMKAKDINPRWIVPIVYEINFVCKKKKRSWKAETNLIKHVSIVLYKMKQNKNKSK